MDRADAVYAAIFLALPLLGLLAAAFVPGVGVLLAVLALGWLMTGFVVGLGFVDA